VITNTILLGRPFDLKGAIVLDAFFLSLSAYFLYAGLSAPIILTIIGLSCLCATLLLIVITARTKICLTDTRLTKRVLRSTTVDLACAELVKIQSDGIGNVQMVAESEGKTIRLNLLTFNTYRKAAVSLEHLSMIGNALSKNANATKVVAIITDHIAHIRNKNTLQSSPLGRMLDTTMLDATTATALVTSLYRIL
jgi:hypothetical protein